MWEIKLTHENGSEILRQVHADELRIGSGGGMDLHIPGLPVGSLFTARDHGGEIEFKASHELDMKVASKWTKKDSYKGSQLPAFKVGTSHFEIRRMAPVKKSPYSPIVWAKNLDLSNDSLGFWHFQGEQLVETAHFDRAKGKRRLNSGIEIQWNFKGKPEVSIREQGGRFELVDLSKNAQGSFEAEWKNQRFVITAVPKKDSLAPFVASTLTPAVQPEWNKFKLGLFAFWTLFFIAIHFIPREEDKLEQAVASVKVESFGTDMPSPTIKNSKNPGGNGKRGGGGVEHVSTKDPRGGAGRSGVGQKSSQSLKAALKSNPGGNAAKIKTASGGAKVKSSARPAPKNFGLPMPMGGGISSALARLDSKVRSGAVGSGAPVVGGGKDLNGRDGVLGSLKNMSGTPGGGGMGIGGVGTKGFGGGGGGGRGAGFGTGIGEGLGEGHGRRQLSFGGGGFIVRGGLEKSEIDRVVQENMSQVRYCFNKRLRSNPNLQGKVVTSFTIGANGKVASSRMKDSNLGAPDVDSCILERISSWQFPKPRGGGTVSATVPFLLRAN